MRKHLLYIGLIAIVSAWGLLLFRQLKKEKAARRISESNVAALRQDTTKKAARLIITRNEFETLFAAQAAQISRMGHQVKNVKGAHFIKYVYLHDTIARTDTIFTRTDSGLQHYPNTYYWQFSHGCFKSAVTYTEGDDYATDTLAGQIEITRLVVSQKPRWRIFKPKMWWRSNWPTQTVIESPCGFCIKENTIFQIKQ